MNELGQSEFDAYGDESEIAGVVIRGAGIRGVATVYEPADSDTRAEVFGSDALSVALKNEGISTDLIIEIGDTEEIDAGPTMSTRSSAPGEKAIEIQVPAAGDGFLQILFTTDENDLASWRLPIATEDTDSTMRSGAMATFSIPGHIAQHDDGGSRTRGLTGAIGRKIVRVLSFKIIDKAIGTIGEYFVKRWEEKNRPYGIRLVTVDNYRDKTAAQIGAADWQRLSQGPALLFIHGTFSRASTAFSQIPPADLEKFINRYEGRVFSFDHPSVSSDPTENAKEFVKRMPKDISLEVDIVCHSRGGHVSRNLSEDQGKLNLGNRKLTVRQIVFVASPNDGTILTDAKYIGDFIDSYTNILSALPDNVVTDTLEILIALLKQVAAGTLKGLDGLQSMNPDGPYLKNVLNVGGKATGQYRAITANFEPTDNKFVPLAKDRLMDQIFKEANDLVVPTEGVYRNNGDVMFPITEVLKIPGTEGIHHGNYFSSPKVLAQLDKWLV